MTTHESGIRALLASRAETQQTKAAGNLAVRPPAGGHGVNG
ncbi:hypothetical protein SUDANB176_04074 [Streptomyces sp. enrichment culture]